MMRGLEHKCTKEVREVRWGKAITINCGHMWAPSPSFLRNEDYTITNITKYIVHKLNFGSHCQLIQITNKVMKWSKQESKHSIA